MSAPDDQIGLRLRVRGQVQGVGFRPFVWTLARQMGLRGRVLNDPEGVLIEATGPALDSFVARLSAEAPPLSRIDRLERSALTRPDWPDEFLIAASEGQGAQTRITPDAATCPECQAEIRSKTDRRAGYAFANCTNCGPRFTIIQDMPYDRAKTTMAAFPLCSDCAAEYADPSDRRFHAQPVACAVCGPRLWLEVGETRCEDDVITRAADLLRAGQILAIKGLGGFHLACDAQNPKALATLRARKHRPAKPFALMGHLGMIQHHTTPSPAEVALLQDPAAPIVVVNAPGHALPAELAPGQTTLGWMLPYTPLHHLLLDAFNGPLVMTSGNLSGEPQVIGNDEARTKLGRFADGFVMHDRAIARRLDDSLERAEPPMVLRRARGRVPGTLPVPKGFDGAPPVTAYGGQMKGALCLLRNGQALLGHHLGDLDDALSFDAFVQADRDYATIFEHSPAHLACDLHPDFAASRHAHAQARAQGLPVTEVQHHHAHMAACMGENQWPLDGGPVAGIILDGLGLGPDGSVWGGEVLLGDYRQVSRAAHLRPAPLIGGDRAQSEPWRNALVRLDQAGLQTWADSLFPNQPLALARQVARSGMNAPVSSSAGRLFDAAAACLGLCAQGQSYEGEAAMRLEALAGQATPDRAYQIPEENGQLDPAPIWPEMRQDLAAGVPPAQIAWRFHAGLAQAFARPARALVEGQKAKAIALSGGCFQNALLHRLICAELADLPVLTHRLVPANDGGLSLGQALITAARALEST